MNQDSKRHRLSPKCYRHTQHRQNAYLVMEHKLGKLRTGLKEFIADTINLRVSTMARSVPDCPMVRYSWKEK